ncbi:MAG: hypothetical protein KJ731_13945 [Alphaproteobacteria bacterium]|nr:hypothetical protein [Alphaproteobacteria bacterium]MBU1281326.1 hypothetical protein [Alphaproteobacteria bacterium]MBU1574126.1 hypothetical protein [Alphaproteobacteria bacterium]MBU1829554.1 hypothetical protein [Alphaproteobacteria bacterium]MBU2079222.1 hypothetical protein [Alphaproteobacteria bacterium]
MTKISPLKYAAFLAILILIFGGVGLAKGGLYIGRHEGDTAHMIEIVLRMLTGQVPHLDFSTPIGIFAFLPAVGFAKAGLGLGQAFIAGQVLIAVLLAPMIGRVAVSRLSGLTAWGFGFVTVSMVLSLVHGENITALSVSMYYNRWAWAAAFIAILLAALPPHDDAKAPRMDGVLDGMIVGAMLAALALLKPTYFVAFVAPIAFAFVLRGAWRSLWVGVLTGGVIAGVIVAIYGVDFFPAYVSDLLSVTRSDTRAAPGAPLMEVINGPRFMIGSLALILSVIVLRQAGQDRAGLVLFLLAPGFVYVTYQNFGNDPKWLMLLAIYLLALRPESGRRVVFNADARNAVAGLALVSFALITPSFQNIVTSPFRHLATKALDYAPQFKTRAELRDVFVKTQRTATVLGRVVMVDDLPQLAPYVVEDDLFKPVTFLGETLPRCTLQSGDVAMHSYMADRLKQPPFNFPQDSQFFVADIASGIWILGGFEPLKGGAPWYYSGTPGIENADAIIIPTCPLDAEIERNALAALETAGLVLRPPLRDDTMLVYPIVK